MQLGNNTECDVVGVCSVRIKMNDGIQRTLTGVRHVLELKKNMISLSAPDLVGYRYTSKGEIMKVVQAILAPIDDKHSFIVCILA